MRNKLNRIVKELIEEAKEKEKSIEETIEYISAYFYEDSDIDYDGWSFSGINVIDGKISAKFIKEFYTECS